MSELWCPHCGTKNRFVRNGSRLDPYNGERLPRLLCNDCGKTTVKPLEFDPKTNIFEKISKPLPVTNRYVITAAQNATNVHQPFLDALLQYCKENSAELLVVPFRYKNPTSTWSKEAKSHDWWHEDLIPFLFCDRVDLNPSLQLLADIRTQPTAIKPLTGFTTITGAKSGILAHPKLQLLSVATPAHKFPKLMTTTGAVTKDDNYTDTVAGKKGEHHHTLGACVVEIDGDKFHMRQINALKNGSFIDLDKKYTKDGVEKAPPAAALIMGDTHVQFADKKVTDATFKGKKSIVSVLQPRTLVWHDVLDFHSQNWHDRRKPFAKLAKHIGKIDNVETEVRLTCDYINQHTPPGVKALIVPSNHNEGLTRWIDDHDWKVDPSHMKFYLRTALAMADSTESQEHGGWTVDPFHYWAKQWITADAVYLERDQPYTIQGIECGYHGDQGPNGAKGAVEGFKGIGAKTVIGHSHKPEIGEGCYQVGTNSRLQLSYNTGPSAWLHTDCVIYANGKRSLINIIDGDWKL